jgi:hypothetical protein
MLSTTSNINDLTIQSGATLPVSGSLTFVQGTLRSHPTGTVRRLRHPSHGTQRDGRPGGDVHERGIRRLALQDLEILNATNPVSMQSAVFANGQLIMQNTPGVLTIQSLNQVLTVGGTNVNAGNGEAVFDNTQLIISVVGGAGIISFSKAHLTNMPPTADQLTVKHPGAVGIQFGLGARFDTAPTGAGHYLNAIDSDGIGPFLKLLVTHLVTPSAAAGLAGTTTSGGAQVTWQ